MRDMLQSEVDHVQERTTQALTAISPANYKFSLHREPELESGVVHVYQ